MSFCQLFFLFSLFSSCLVRTNNKKICNHRQRQARHRCVFTHHPMTCMSMTSQMRICFLFRYSLKRFCLIFIDFVFFSSSKLDGYCSPIFFSFFFSSAVVFFPSTLLVFVVIDLLLLFTCSTFGLTIKTTKNISSTLAPSTRSSSRGSLAVSHINKHFSSAINNESTDNCFICTVCNLLVFNE